MLEADGLRDAIIGKATGEELVVYSLKKCVDILVEREGMTREIAMEWLTFNTICVNSGQALFIDDENE